MQQINPKWLAPFDPVSWKNKKAWESEKTMRVQHNLNEPVECPECGRTFLPKRTNQATCRAAQCLIARERRQAKGA